MIAHNPLHGSGRAGFPHPALASGDDAHAPQRIGMTDRRRRQPAGDETPHTIPQDAAVLVAPRQRAMPEPPHLEPKNPQRVVVCRNTVNLPLLLRRCSETSQVQWVCPTSQVRSSSAYVLRLSRRVPRLLRPWANLGSPGSLTRCLRTCSGSLTARDSGTPRDIGAPDGAFRFLLQRRRPGGFFFRG